MSSIDPQRDAFYRRARAELDQAVADGLMHITGYDEHGQPYYALTDEGRRVVEQMGQVR